MRALLRRAGVDVEVSPAIVFDVPPGTQFDVQLEPKGVVLYRLGNVVDAFASLTGVLTIEQINKTFAVARKPETWEGDSGD